MSSIYLGNMCHMTWAEQSAINWITYFITFSKDGSNSKTYCRNLCLLSKLFLDSKTMFYDVEPFWFYVLIEKKRGDVFTTVGYFSKEKNPVIDYNLSCIMVLPAYMGKGYGKFCKWIFICDFKDFTFWLSEINVSFSVIDLSYGLSRQEGIFGSPERPLSDLGLISYRSYWKDIIINYMLSLTKENSFSVRELSLQSGNLPEFWKVWRPSIPRDLTKWYCFNTSINANS